MTRTAVITQPTYLPWLGYFEQLARADVLIFLDSVPFERRSWQNRNRLKGSNGNPFWMTVPLQSCRRETLLKDVRISKERPRWRTKHIRTIRSVLSAAPFFNDVSLMIERWLDEDYDLLADMNIDGITKLAHWLDLRPGIVRASKLPTDGCGVHRIIELCQQVQADHYYTSFGSRAYMTGTEHLFSEAGIEVSYQRWTHPVYRQRGSGFLSHLSALDAFANLGREAARKLLGSQQLQHREGHLTNRVNDT